MKAAQAEPRQREGRPRQQVGRFLAQRRDAYNNIMTYILRFLRDLIIHVAVDTGIFSHRAQTRGCNRHQW